jgi:hypothetical protein
MFYEALSTVLKACRGHGDKSNSFITLVLGVSGKFLVRTVLLMEKEALDPVDRRMGRPKD